MYLHKLGMVFGPSILENDRFNVSTRSALCLSITLNEFWCVGRYRLGPKIRTVRLKFWIWTLVVDQELSVTRLKISLRSCKGGIYSSDNKGPLYLRNPN